MALILGLSDEGRKLHMKRLLDQTVRSRLFHGQEEDAIHKLLEKKIEDLSPLTTRDMVLDIVRSTMAHILYSFLLARGNRLVEDELWDIVTNSEGLEQYN